VIYGHKSFPKLDPGASRRSSKIGSEDAHDKFKTRLKNKHASLFVRFLIEEGEKKFNKIATCQRIKVTKTTPAMKQTKKRNINLKLFFKFILNRLNFIVFSASK